MTSNGKKFKHYSISDTMLAKIECFVMASRKIKSGSYVKLNCRLSFFRLVFDDAST